MKDKYGRPRRLQWLHAIGYVTTAIVGAQLLLVAAALINVRLQLWGVEAEQVKASRTHQGPIQSSDDIVVGSAAYMLGQLPSLHALRGNGLRFVAMPSFNETHFAVAISLPDARAQEAEGVISRFDWRNRYTPLGQRRFRMPASAYRSLVAKMDKLTDDWPGTLNECLDGTPIGFERVRGGRITSGLGNCSVHYEQVGRLMWNYLRQFAPGDDLPPKGDWEPADNNR